MPAGTRELRFWIDTALECNRRDHTRSFGPGDQRGPFFSARALGMAMAALQCAYEGNGAGAVYQVAPLMLPPGPNATIRAAAACHQLLVRRYPNQSRILYPLWDTWLRLFEFDVASTPAEAAARKESEEAGREIGHKVHMHANKDSAGASTGLDDREIDASGKYEPAVPRIPYVHNIPYGDPMQGFAGATWGKATRLKATFVPNFPPPPGRTGPAVPAKAATQSAPATPAVTNFDDTNGHYQDDLKEVVKKGGFQDGDRTGEEEIIGVFWGYDGPSEIGTPPRLYMQVALTVLDQFHARDAQPISDSDELKVIAAIAIAMADAGIDAWHYKYSDQHMLWRPALGIPHSGDLGWLPYGRPDTNGTGTALTPNFPAYPSGHATFGAAAFQILRLFLVEKGAVPEFEANGLDKVRFTFTSDEYNGRNTDPRTGLPRPYIAMTYDTLWKAITDNSVSRVYLGVHWQFDGVTKKPAAGGDADGEFGEPASPQDLGRRGGVWLGVQIANQIAAALGVSPETIRKSMGEAGAAGP